jgi:hypothetical protein
MGQRLRVAAPARNAPDAGCPDWPDWPEPTDAEIDRWWADRLASESELPPDPSDAGRDSAAGTARAIVRAAEAEPLSPALIAALASADMAALDDAGLVSAAAAWTRVRNLADGQVATAVAALHDRTSDAGLVGGRVLVAAEIGVALRLGSGGADRLVATSVELATRLPMTLAAVRDGSVSWHKASTLADRTRLLDDAVAAAAVEARVLASAAARTPALHAAAVRRAADRLDPAGLEERRARAESTVALVRTHLGDGMGELVARMRSEDLDTIYLAADTHARRGKAAGDPRTLDQLRVAALTQWAAAFLGYGDPVAMEAPTAAEDDADGSDDDGSDDDALATRDAGAEGSVDREGAAAAAPTRHGRPARVRILTSLPTLLGAGDVPGELADSGAALPASTIRFLASRGVALRRMLIDDVTGELVDLGAESYLLPARDGVRRPVCHELCIVIRQSEWPGLREQHRGDIPRAIRDLLDAPATAPELDSTPDAYPAPVRLADFVATRSRHPSNPCAGESAASAGDVDHIAPAAAGGPTTRDNLHPPTRRWHRLTTHGGWRVKREPTGGLTWTSPLGRAAITHPHDYRRILDDDP